MRFEIITAVTMQIIRLMNITPCSRVEICGSFNFFYCGKIPILFLKGIIILIRHANVALGFMVRGLHVLPSLVHGGGISKSTF